MTMAKTGTFIEAVGRRKTASARVRLTPGKQETMLINERSLTEYFPVKKEQDTVREALENAGEKFSLTAKVFGGGLKAQSEAIRHGIARALIKHNPELRKDLKQKGFLKRDPRAKERKKFGLKAARRAPQWSKR